jgi:hypothetical protein
VLIALAATTVRGDALARADAAAWYGAAALAWTLSAARVGSSFGYFLDLHLAVVVFLGPRLFAPRGALAGRWGWLLALQIVAADVGTGAALAVNLARTGRETAELPALCERIRGEPLALAEEAGLMRACGRPALLHPFIVTSLAEQGLWDPTRLETALRWGSYPIVVLPFDPRLSPNGAHAERWTPGLRAALAEAPVVERGPAGRWLALW